MAESKICGTVIGGQPVQVKVIVDFQRIADKLAAKARKQKNGKASDCHGCVRVEVVPIKRAAETRKCARTYCHGKANCASPSNCGLFE